MADAQSLGDAPIEPAYIEQMNELAHFLDAKFNPDVSPGKRKIGFVLMVFPFFDQPGRCNYISNANRTDVKVLLREQLSRFEGMPDAKGTA